MESKTLISSIRENISKVMVGSEETINLLLTALIAEGHVLIEDVPGMGKTVLAKSLAKSVSLEFNRIQFTPDLLPSDVTGLNYFDQKANDFVFSPGPAFCNLLLADEINRATPRTQSSLLECMGERQITVDGVTRPLSAPFRHRHAESHRNARHLSPAGSPARPLFNAHFHGLSHKRAGARHLAALYEGRAARNAAKRLHA